MSLQVWLPLLGNLDNKGSSNSVIAVDGATVNTSGKIGSCYSFDGSNDFISITDANLYNTFTGGDQPFSIAMWVYHGDSTRAILFGDYGLAGTISFNIELTTAHAVRFYWNGSPDYTTSANVGSSTWAHIIVTYNGSTINTYLNGSLVHTRAQVLGTRSKTSGSFYLGRDNRTGTTALNGRINDFRIYDHCLSISEAHELAQGLVLHYKLDQASNASYSDFGYDPTVVIDSSGYENNGAILNTYDSNANSTRYDSCLYLSAGSSVVDCGRGGMVTDSITVNMWLKSSAWANPVSCTEGGGWNFETSDTCFRFPVYISGVGYKYGKSTTTKAQICDNNWHMLTGIYDRVSQKIQIYVDGKLDNDFNAETSNPIGYHATNHIWIGGEATASGYSNGMIGYFSDFRIYATPLSADDVMSLYKVESRVARYGNCQAYEFSEDKSPAIKKTGVFENANISELLTLSRLKYDKNIYIEPDGSAWVRIYHHNNPGAGSFASSNDFEHSVYLDENRWFNVEVCYDVFQWELMMKGKFTSAGSEWKVRWIQACNPMTATYDDVNKDNVTKITTDGYSSSPSAWGGLYAKKSSAYLTTNNGTSGNWWGAVGSYSIYQSGIPGWGPSATVTTTGFNDLYLRIDNIFQDNMDKVHFKTNGIILADKFIET